MTFLLKGELEHEAEWIRDVEVVVTCEGMSDATGAAILRMLYPSHILVNITIERID